MSVGFLSARPARHLPVPADSPGPWAAAFCLDWRAARRAERSCCCPAKPRVIAILPPTADRSQPADLLLCWHHYRASRQAILAADAMLVGIDGTPIGGEEWPPAPAAPPDPGDRSFSPSRR
jgi:hypothetical protein